MRGAGRRSPEDGGERIVERRGHGGARVPEEAVVGQASLSGLAATYFCQNCARVCQKYWTAKSFELFVVRGSRFAVRGSYFAHLPACCLLRACASSIMPPSREGASDLPSAGNLMPSANLVFGPPYPARMHGLQGGPAVVRLQTVLGNADSKALRTLPAVGDLRSCSWNLNSYPSQVIET